MGRREGRGGAGLREGPGSERDVKLEQRPGPGHVPGREGLGGGREGGRAGLGTGEGTTGGPARAGLPAAGAPAAQRGNVILARGESPEVRGRRFDAGGPNPSHNGSRRLRNAAYAREKKGGRVGQAQPLPLLAALLRAESRSVKPSSPRPSRASPPDPAQLRHGTAASRTHQHRTSRRVRPRPPAPSASAEPRSAAASPRHGLESAKAPPPSAAQRGPARGAEETRAVGRP